MRRRLWTWLSILSLLLTGAVVTASPAAAHPYCGQVWGSLDKTNLSGIGGSFVRLTGVRAGRHPCFDRLVLDIDAPLDRWSVRYVEQVVSPFPYSTQPIVPVSGGARLEVEVGLRYSGPLGTPGDTLVDTTGYRTFRDVAWADQFMFGNLGTTHSRIGLGVRGKLPFRAFVLPGPGTGSRLVIDVGHRWCAPGHVAC